MAVDVWKAFEQNPITHSVAHHLMAIAALHEIHGYARVSDVAKRLNITRGSASLTLKALKEKGLVEEDDNRFVRLSVVGSALAASVRANKVMLQRFFCDVLGVDAETAAVDTCKIEHLVSAPTALRLGAFMRFVESSVSAAQAFKAAWREFADSNCGGDPAACPPCEEVCIRTVFKKARATSPQVPK